MDRAKCALFCCVCMYIIYIYIYVYIYIYIVLQTWRDHKTNEEIMNELKVTLILDKIKSYKRKGQTTEETPEE
jgi:hypothetical protein